MSHPARPGATALYALVAFIFLALLALVIWLAPLGIREARQSWFFYKNRNNPTCHWKDPRDCFPFALEKCPPPHYSVDCVPKDQSYREGMCICGMNAGGPYFQGAVDVAGELEYERLHTDAGADASR